ncbi:bactericidal permeability-increasing protein [Chelmon rostratus]|uniref:bactericidal permeability-increasing protein n=1 Tax=Chelmon rostratus TaxID=109905 RepID=UPI001BE715C4|nr:bactericidal permeability-increasing protein [Chelmon rostratus]
MLPAVITALMLLSFTHGENPAVQVILTNKGLQYGKHVGAGWIQDKLASVTFPDISGKIRISIFGNLDYTLTGVTITKCDFPEPSVEFYQDATGFKTSMSGLCVALTGGWMTHFGLIHCSGSFNLAVFSVDVTSVVELGRDADGHLSVTSVSCDAQVGDVDLQLYGGTSWIFQPVLGYFKGPIRDEIKGRICPNVEEIIVRLESHLQAMNVSFDVDHDLTLDLPLTGLPVINSSSLNLGLKGEFYSIKTHAEPPFEAQPFTVPKQPGYMLSVGLSEFTLNSASYGYYSAGLLQALINDSMIPPGSHIHLNTSSMGPFIPQLPDMFPGLLMNLQVYAREVPLFSFQPGAVKLGLLGAVKAFAIQANGTQTPLFKLNVDSAFSGKVWTADGKLKGSMAMNNLTLTLASSEVGTFKTDAIGGLARMASTVLVAKLNEKLGKGVDLPRMKHAELVNTVLAVEEGFIAISSDAQVLQTDGHFN